MKSIPIHPAVYDTYRRAAAMLAKVMGGEAPNAVVLIQHELTMRDPKLIADDFLLSIRWRKHQQRLDRQSRRVPARNSLAFHALRRLKACTVSPDPSRN